MEPNTQSALVSKKMLWAGWIMSILPVLMFCFSASMKFMKPPDMEKGLEHIGWTVSQMLGLGILEVTCTIIYLIPRTAVLGAILLTGYIGGAIATHVRVNDAIFVHIIIGVLIWGGVYLRDPRLRALIPLRKPLV
jgi:hypothetical protein